MSLGCGVGLWESSEVRFNPTGQVTIYTGAHSHGQSHDTTFAQIAADELGVPMENIDIVHGDTDKGTFGMGTYGSRSLTVGGIAIVNACEKIIAKGKKLLQKCLKKEDDELNLKMVNLLLLNQIRKKQLEKLLLLVTYQGKSWRF